MSILARDEPNDTESEDSGGDETTEKGRLSDVIINST